MNKFAIMAMGASATVAGTGAVYYVSPARQANLDTPQLLVAGAPDEVMAKVRMITLQQLMIQTGKREDIGKAITLDHRLGPGGEDIVAVRFFADDLFLIHLRPLAKPDGKTELDITAEMPESRFAKDPKLHPYDLKVMSALADAMATEFVSSVVSGQRMASSSELEAILRPKFGLDDEQARTFGERVQAALKDVYGDKIEQLESHAAPIASDAADAASNTSTYRIERDRNGGYDPTAVASDAHEREERERRAEVEDRSE